jgi:hypothetical protein
MGAGLALQAKKKWPSMYQDYRWACQDGMLVPGKLFNWQVNGGPLIVCLATKDHWRSPSKMGWIKTGIVNLTEWLVSVRSIGWKYETIAIPPLGCGLGGLDWSQVRPLIVDAFQDLPIRALIYGKP